MGYSRGRPAGRGARKIDVHGGERRGWLLDRIYGANKMPWGRNPLEFDPTATQQTVDRAGRLFGPGRYFGLEIEGFDNVPSGPTMVVSNHSGGTTIPDVWGFLIAWYRHFGVRRPIHPMAHEIILSNRFTGVYFARRGVLRGGRSIALSALRDARHDLMVMPGGDRDTWRPYSKRYEVCFGGRSGYARLAILAGVPIVPVANAGAHETLIVLSDGRRFAKAIGLHAFARAEVFPVHLSLPWGFAGDAAVSDRRADPAAGSRRSRARARRGDGPRLRRPGAGRRAEPSERAETGVLAR